MLTLYNVTALPLIRSQNEWPWNILRTCAFEANSLQLIYDGGMEKIKLI